MDALILCQQADDIFQIPLQYHVLRQKGTEPAGTGEYDKFYNDGELWHIQNGRLCPHKPDAVSTVVFRRQKRTTMQL